MAQLVKNLPAIWETWVLYLGWEDLLEKGKATHLIFLPGEIHGQRSLAGYSPWGHKESDTTDGLVCCGWALSRGGQDSTCLPFCVCAFVVVKFCSVERCGPWIAEELEQGRGDGVQGLR